MGREPLNLTGRTLGEFVLGERIGVGGFGTIYRAVQPLLQREAVVKVAHADLERQSRLVADFLSEARIASRIDHPYAAHIYAFGAEADGTLWIAMELVRGSPLNTFLAEMGPMAPARAVPFLARLAEVIHAAHEAGVVHRDIKPSNVMVVNRAGTMFPKLLDLGIAREVRSDEPTGPVNTLVVARARKYPSSAPPSVDAARKAADSEAVADLVTALDEVLAAAVPAAAALATGTDAAFDLDAVAAAPPAQIKFTPGDPSFTPQWVVAARNASPGTGAPADVDPMAITARKPAMSPSQLLGLQQQRRVGRVDLDSQIRARQAHDTSADMLFSPGRAPAQPVTPTFSGATASPATPANANTGPAAEITATGILAAAERIVGSDTARGDSVRVAGTPLYMAPEQWVSAHTARAGADIYSLGVVAYEVLTGKPPFDGRSLRDLALKHARAPLPPLPAELPASLTGALERAMAKRAVDRFSTALDFAAALRDAVGIDHEASGLPTLDGSLREELLLRAPQPLAETVATLDNARTPGAAQHAIRRVTHVIAQYTGLLALAARARTGPGRYAEAAPVRALMARLREEGLDAKGWWELARECVRPFAGLVDAYPVPELVQLFFNGRVPVRNGVDALLIVAARDPGDDDDHEDLREHLVSAMPTLENALVGLRALLRYRVGVTVVDEAGPGIEIWEGLRRRARRRLAIAHGLNAGQPLLLAQNDTTTLGLDPFMFVAEPSLGMDPDLFMLAGASKGRARFTCAPTAFVRSDEPWPATALADDPSDAEATDAVATRSPYLGLSSFQPDDAGVYFGREREVDEFVNRMREAAWIAIVGPSGAGKSSFVQAGVVPALGSTWRAITLRPGARPLTALANALAPAGVAVTSAQLAAEPRGLVDRLRFGANANARAPHLLIVIDQFEELFTLCHDATKRRAFAQAIASLAGRSSHDELAAFDAARGGDRVGPRLVRVVVTLRDDFMIRAAEVPELKVPIASNLQILTTPSDADLLRIVTEPARRAGHGFDDPDLPLDMVEAVRGQPATLALLSFTAEQLWRLRDRSTRNLLRRAYAALGGVGGAMAQHAEESLERMPEESHRIVRELFRHLVTADGTRAAMSRRELIHVAGGEVAEGPLEELIHSRLLTAQEDPVHGEAIEIVHEALLTMWPRLVKWRREDAEVARLQDHLRAAARAWQEQHRSPAVLWRGDVLAEYRRWRDRYPGRPTELEEAFAAASLRDERTRRNRWRVAIAGALTASIAGAVVFASLRHRAVENEARAERERDARQTQLRATLIDRGRETLAARDFRTARDSFASADELTPLGNGERFMYDRAREPFRHDVMPLGPKGLVARVEVLPGTEVAVYATEDGKVTLVELDTLREHVVDAGGDKASNLAVTATGGGQVAIGRDDGTLVVVDATGREVLRTQAEMTRIINVAWAGDAVVAVHASGAAYLQRPAQPALRLGGDDMVGARGVVGGATRFALFVTAPSPALIVFEADGTRRHMAPLASPAVTAMAVSPDGTAVAVAVDTELQVVPFADGAQAQRVGPLPATISSLAWSDSSAHVHVALADQSLLRFTAKNLSTWPNSTTTSATAMALRAGDDAEVVVGAGSLLEFHRDGLLTEAAMLPHDAWSVRNAGERRWVVLSTSGDASLIQLAQPHTYQLPTTLPEATVITRDGDVVSIAGDAVHRLTAAGLRSIERLPKPAVAGCAADGEAVIVLADHRLMAVGAKTRELAQLPAAADLIACASDSVAIAMGPEVRAVALADSASHTYTQSQPPTELWSLGGASVVVRAMDGTTRALRPTGDDTSENLFTPGDTQITRAQSGSSPWVDPRTNPTLVSIRDEAGNNLHAATLSSFVTVASWARGQLWVCESAGFCGLYPREGSGSRVRVETSISYPLGIGLGPASILAVAGESGVVEFYDIDHNKRLFGISSSHPRSFLINEQRAVVTSPSTVIVRNLSAIRD